MVDAPGWDVAEIAVALTDAFDAKNRIGIAMEGEMLDSVSNVQLGAVIQSQRGRNLTINRFWQEHDAKVIMDGWADRLRTFIDQSHKDAGR